MGGWRKRSIFITFILTPCWFATGFAFGHGSDDLRLGEPVVVSGAPLAPLFGAPVTDLHLFAWVDDAWVEITFQLDEQSPGGSYFEPDDGLLDANDSVSFQPQDGGIEVPVDMWIDDVSSWSYPRIALHVTDPVEGGSRYAYLYRSDDLPPADTTAFVAYDLALDRVMAQDYEVGFDDVLMNWDELLFCNGATCSEDLMDREKLRIAGNLPPLNLPFEISEQDIAPLQTLVVTGGVRILRRFEGEISLFTFTFPVAFERHYYRRFIGFPDDVSVEIPDNTGVNSVRFSLDLSPEAVGTAISDANNPMLIVDGEPDANVDTLVDMSQQGHYWLRYENGGNVMVNVGSFAGVAMQTLFYFHDDMAGGTLDGTDDTGDLVSFGDSGLWFQDPQPGMAQLGFRSYFGAGLTGVQAQQYFDQPLDTQVTEESFADTLGIWLERWGTGDPMAPDVLFFTQFFNAFPMVPLP